MKFEAKDKDGNVKMWTTSDSCVPSDSDIQAMMAAGYKCYKDGKVYKPGKPTK